MKLTKSEVEKVARLANLPLNAEEEGKYAEQLSKILDYIDLLEKVDTSKVTPTFNITGLENITREDEMSNSLTQEESLMNSSKTKDGYFVTKGVFDNE